MSILNPDAITADYPIYSFLTVLFLHAMKNIITQPVRKDWFFYPNSSNTPFKKFEMNKIMLLPVLNKKFY